jgi:hypothetical protein
MFYFLFENKADSKNELSLINQITRDLGCEKNKIHAVNFPQSSSSHYDFYKVCENTFNFDRDNHPSNFFVLCADVDDRDLLIMLLKHNDKIKLKLKVDNKDFLNEHQVYLIYKLGRYSAHSSYRRTTREKEIVDLRENLLSSLTTNW